MSPVIAFDIAVVAQKVKVLCCYRGPVWSEKVGCWWRWWVSGRSGWLLELLTELINQPQKARLIDMFLEEGRIWENVIIVAKQVDLITIADFDGDRCDKSWFRQFFALGCCFIHVLEQNCLTLSAASIFLSLLLRTFLNFKEGFYINHIYKLASRQTPHWALKFPEVELSRR